MEEKKDLYNMSIKLGNKLSNSKGKYNKIYQKLADNLYQVLLNDPSWKKINEADYLDGYGDNHTSLEHFVNYDREQVIDCIIQNDTKTNTRNFTFSSGNYNEIYKSKLSK